jgi:hypothetical protein
MDLYPQYTGQETWSPQGEFGQHGEFEGWRSAEDPPSYRSDWQDYPADEFTGIQSNVPSGGGFLRNIFEKYGGNLGWLGGLGRGFDTPYGGLTPEEEFIMKQQRDLQKENFREYFYNQYKPGPWNEFNPPSRQPYPSFEQDWGADLLAKIYTSEMPGMQDPGFFWDSLTPEAEAINKVLNISGMEGMRQGSVKDWNYKDFRKMVPDWLWDQLPEDAFETLSDFRNQQPITVI